MAVSLAQMGSGCGRFSRWQSFSGQTGKYDEKTAQKPDAALYSEPYTPLPERPHTGGSPPIPFDGIPLQHERKMGCKNGLLRAEPLFDGSTVTVAPSLHRDHPYKNLYRREI